MGAASGEGRREPLAWWWLAVLVAAVLPSIGSLGAPLVSDDGAILGYVHRHGAWSDWLTSQYDLRTVRFWRPLVTGSFALQEWLTGVDPLALRLFNLAGHASSALLLGGIARELGAGRLGALVAGLLFAWYPEQGGNVTWIAGRVDSQSVPVILLSLWLALRGAAIPAALAAFAALATKELAVVAPVWAVLFAWTRGDRPVAALRVSLPVVVGVAVAFVWRRLAIGAWVGGYPAQELEGGPLELLGAGVRALLPSFGLLLGALAGLLLVLRPTGALRRTAGTLIAALVGVAPLVHVWAGGEVPPEHARTLWLPEGALALAIGLALRPDAGPAPPLRGVRLGASHLVVLVVLLVRGEAARTDVATWAAGGLRAERELDRARAAVAQDTPSDRPALASGFSRLLRPEHAAELDGLELDLEQARGAYVLHWGVADRFRAPFDATPRPIWPWRAIFPAGGESAQRPSAHPLRGGVARPLDGGPSAYARLGLTCDGGPPPAVLPVDAGFVLTAGEADGTPRLAAQAPEGTSPTAWELILVTELGYRAARLEVPTARLELSLRDALLAVSDGFLLALDFRCERAFLELRALGPGGTAGVLGTTEWIELAWSRAELHDLFLPK